MENTRNIMKGAEPIFKIGNDNGFLFIHGFTGAPYEGRELANFVYEKLGATVSVPLLPGHGTVPDDMIGVSWFEWYDTVRHKYLQLKSQCKKVVVCGLSMGAALSLHLASHHPVDGIITLAGPAYLKDWRLALLPVARYIIKYQHKSKGPDIKNTELKKNVPTYLKYPVKSVEQLIQLLHHAKDDLSEVTAPALLIHSKKDRTIKFENLQYIYDHISSLEKRKVELENSYHIVSIDIEKDVVFKEVNMFLQKIFT